MKKIFVLVIFLAVNSYGNADLAFRRGEKFTYTVEKRIFKETFILGEATLELKEITHVRGVKCYHFVFDVKSDIRIGSQSNSILRICVHNRGESYCSTLDFITQKLERHIDEKYPGRKRKEEKTTIEIANNKVYYTDGSIVKMHTWTKMRDNLATVYWLRSMKDLERRSSISTVSLAENQKEIFKLQIENRGIKKVKVPLGEFNCIKLEYLLLETNIFDISENMILWLSTDEKRIPVMMNTGGLIFRLIKVKR